MKASDPTPRPAAGIIVRTPENQVLIGLRQPYLPFLGGFYSFPGGRVEKQDQHFAQSHWPTLSDGAARAAVLRELFEECGVIASGKRVHPVPKDLRQQSWWEVHESLNLALRPEALTPCGLWITPAWAPRRFKTDFFLLNVEAPCPADPEDQEFSFTGFRPVSDLLTEYQNLQAMLPPPTRLQLEALNKSANNLVEDLQACPGADGSPITDLEGMAGIRQLPLLSPTLPPATRTNCYLCGDEEILIVDPATYDPHQRTELATVLNRLKGEGRTLKAVFLTHHHRDHVAAASWVANAFSLPIWAHTKTAELLDDIQVNRSFDEGDLIELGSDRRGEAFRLKCLLTPGHAPGHLCLEDQRPGGRALLVGDMVASTGSIIIDPDEGDMREYIRQLKRLQALGPRVLFPAHGAPIVDGMSKLQATIDHRLYREQKVIQALQQFPQGATAQELLSLAYDDTKPELYPLAERSCLAHLLKLAEDGLAHRQSEQFRLNPTTATLS